MIRLPLLLILLFATSYCANKDVLKQRKFNIEKMWVRYTPLTEYLGFRPLHRMSTLLTDDLVIQGNAIDSVIAYNRKTGIELWRNKITGGVEGGGVLGDQRLYLPTSDGYLHSIDLNDGRVHWKFALQSEGLSRPTLDRGTLFFIAGNNVLFAVEAKTGKKLWQYKRRSPSGLSIRGGSQPTVEGKTVYTGFSDGFLVALDRSSGKVLWEKKLGQGSRFKDVDSSAVISGKRLYVSSYDGALYCLDKANGNILWQLADGGYSKVHIHKDKIFYATSSRKVIAMEKRSGKVLWEQPLKNGFATTPVYYRGLLIYGESDGHLQFVNAETGEPVDRFSPGKGLFAQPTIDFETGELYFISRSANLYALKMSWLEQNRAWPWE